MQTRRDRKIYAILTQVVVVFLVAIFIEAILIRHIGLQFNADVTIVDILSLIVTMLMALYIAYVVDEQRSIKQTINNECEFHLRKLAEKSSDLFEKMRSPCPDCFYLNAWPKQMNSHIEIIGKILKKEGYEDTSLLNDIKEDIKELRVLTTTTVSKREAPDDYFVIRDNQLIDIAPERESRIIEHICSLQSSVYQLRSLIMGV